MIVLNDRGTVLLNATNIWVQSVTDKDDKNNVLGWRVCGQNGSSTRHTVLAQFKTEEEAKGYLKNLAQGFGVEV